MKPYILLIIKEIKEIFFSKSAVLFTVILCVVTGYSFYSAVMLYSNASVSAVNNPLYAAGFEPVPGVFVPTWGGLFILFSLFFPFIIIPGVVLEKERNTLVILLQVPFTMNEILTSKIIADVLFLIFTFLIMSPTIFIWKMYGGHVACGELILLMIGYFFYGLFVIGVATFSASLFKNTSSASILSILLITLSWIIDFGKDMSISPLILTLSEWTTSKMLKFFEQGIFSLTAVVYFVVVFFVFIFLARSFLDIKFNFKWMIAGMVSVLCGVLLITGINYNVDVTESYRNSFSPAITHALKKVPPVEIDVYLRRNDSRFRDFEQSFLKRLLLIKPDVKVRLIEGTPLEKNYGLFVYRINGREARTYSNSEEEIFPLIFGLSGIKVSTKAADDHYPGYPLVVNRDQLLLISYTYYLFIPLMFLSIFMIRYIDVKRRLKP